MQNDNVLTIPRDLLQDLIDDVSDYAASREFKPREKVWRDDVLARARDLLATPLPEPRAEVTDDQIAAMFERVTGYSIENGRAALNDADILGFARELLEAARTGASS